MKNTLLPTLLAGLLFALPMGPSRAAPASAPATVIERVIWLQADAQQINPVLAYIGERMPGARFERLEANSLRSWQMIQRGEPACRPTTIRTPAREAEAYFADTMLAPPAELLVRRDKLSQLPRNRAGEVDLKRLLQQAQLRGAYARGRSFGAHIDGILASQGKNPMLADYATAGYGDRMRHMLARERTDFLLESQGALAQMQERGLPAEEFTNLPIQGATEPLLLGIACPRTPWGLAMIRAIDQILGTPAGAAHLRSITEGWFHAEAKERFAAQIEQFFRRRSKPQLPQ